MNIVFIYYSLLLWMEKFVSYVTKTVSIVCMYATELWYVKIAMTLVILSCVSAVENCLSLTQ